MAVIYMIVVAGLIRPSQALYCSCVVDHRLRQPLKTPVGPGSIGDCMVRRKKHSFRN
jgi:hypothetical protein